VLLFSGLEPQQTEQEMIVALQKKLNQAFSGVVQTFIVAREEVTGVDSVIFDKHAAIHKRYHVNTPAIYVIRPDNVIGFHAGTLDENSLDVFFGQYLK
jgi:hypothetical protein